MNEVHKKFLVCDSHSREVIWKVLRYALYKETETVAPDNDKDIFKGIVTFYKNNETRRSNLHDDCTDIMQCYDNLDLTEKDNLFTSSIIKEIDSNNNLTPIADAIQFVKAFRSLVHCASLQTLKKIMKCQYEFDSHFSYKGHQCSSISDLIKNLSTCVEDILSFLFSQNVNGFVFVPSPNYSADKISEINRIMSSPLDNLQAEIIKQRMYNEWQVEKLKDRQHVEEVVKFNCEFFIELSKNGRDDFTNVEELDDSLSETLENSFKVVLQDRFHHFKEWEVNANVKDLSKLDKTDDVFEQQLECVVEAKCYKGNRSFKDYAKKRDPKSRDLWKSISTAIIDSCGKTIGIQVILSRPSVWRLGSLIFQFCIKKTNKTDWIYEDLENLKRAIKFGLCKLFNSYEMSVNFSVKQSNSSYTCSMLFSTTTTGVSNEIHHFINEVELEPLKCVGKKFIGGFTVRKCFTTFN